MKKMFSLGFAAAMTVFTSGCRTQIVTVDVTPADARVIANGVEYNNKSPIFIEANTGRQLAITAYKEGYRDKLYVIDYSLSDLGRIEAWTSFLILPAFGLLCDDAWELNENNVTLTLEPLSEAAKAEAAGVSPRAVPADKSPVPKNLDQTTDPDAKRIFNQI